MFLSLSMAAASPHPTRRRLPGRSADSSYTAHCNRRLASSTPPQLGGGEQGMTQFKFRLARAAWMLASLAALAAALGAPTKWL